MVIFDEIPAHNPNMPIQISLSKWREYSYQVSQRQRCDVMKQCHNKPSVLTEGTESNLPSKRI